MEYEVSPETLLWLAAPNVLDDYPKITYTASQLAALNMQIRSGHKVGNDMYTTSAKMIYGGWLCRVGEEP